MRLDCFPTQLRGALRPDYFSNPVGGSDAHALLSNPIQRRSAPWLVTIQSQERDTLRLINKPVSEAWRARIDSQSSFRSAMRSVWFPIQVRVATCLS